MDEKKKSPWFLSEKDALIYEKAILRTKEMATKKLPPAPPAPTVPYKYTAQDSEDIRREFGEAVGKINLGDEISMSTSGNSVVVIAAGPMTLVVVEAVKKLMEEISKIKC